MIINYSILQKKFMRNNSELIFKKFKKAYVSKKHLAWLNDPEVRLYSTVKKKHTPKSQKKYLKNKINDKSTVLFRIIYQKSHIGLLEISRINKFHRFCEINYLIGEKKFWGLKLGTQTVSYAVNYAKYILNLKKVVAGTFLNNKASIKVLLKNGFKKEGVIKNFYQDHFKKKRIHHLWLGKNL